MTDQRDAVRRGYDDLAEAYLQQRSPDDAELDLLDTFVEHLPSTARVLDAGCGSGDPVTASLASDFGVVGLDISRRQVELARDRVPVARFLQGDLISLPFANATFDGLVAFHSIIHVPTERHAEVYQEFERVLRPGGHILVTIGPGAWEGTNPDWLDAGAEMRWSFPDLETSLDLLSEAGYKILDRTTVGDQLGGGSWVYVLAQKREN